MKIGVLGTGGVGQTIAARLADLGHDVMIGTRDPDQSRARTKPDWRGISFADWIAQHSHVQLGTFAETAAHGELLFNCTSGMISLDALALAGADNLADKVLIDVSNPLDYSSGALELSVCNTDSLGEQIQRAFPRLKVVKALNTMNASVMVNPALLPGEHAVFVAGDDTPAKATVTDFLRREFGWRQVIDLGDITGARAVEMLLPLWVRLMPALGTIHFNFAVAR
jgi:predicted dinucleotide-binding enzyme